MINIALKKLTNLYKYDFDIQSTPFHHTHIVKEWNYCNKSWSINGS